MPLAGSSDGELFAVASSLDGNDRPLTLEIRRTDTQEIVHSYPASETSFWPVLVSADKSKLYGTKGGDELLEFDLATGQTKPVLTSATNHEPTPVACPDGSINADRSLVIGEEGALTHTGTYVSVKDSDVQAFDQFGDAWFKQRSGWLRVDKNGRTSLHPKRPGYLVKDPTMERGSMKLVVETIERKHKGSTAFVTLVWLDHAKASREQRASRAALVFAGADVRATGFVPNRDMVYVVSDTGSFFVPYATKEATTD